MLKKIGDLNFISIKDRSVTKNLNSLLNFTKNNFIRMSSSESNTNGKSIDYQDFITPLSASRKYSAIRALQKYTTLPGMISLGGGLPNASTFPFESITLKLKTGETVEVPQADLNRALQYGSTQGDQKFLDWIRALQKKIHDPMVDYDICIGNGSQDLIVKAMESLIAPGETMLIEAPTYVGILAFLKPLGVKFKEVTVDNDGLNPDSLEETLKNWPDLKTRPKVLYTVPTSGNPTGLSTTFERKKKVYEIAKKYNLIILEDDPYYYMQFQTPLAKSYFSLDTDARVLRFDSFSKIISGGARLGWVSGPPALIERIILHGMSTNLHPSGVSQMLVYQVLEKWGHDGFIKHTEQVAKFYKERSEKFVACLEKHLKGKATWTIPNAGMFVWIDLKPSGIEVL
ncbi:pyridoxal phosphate-dependent transferase [Globomyces pollinis-pini]|nr:pyridoxal phosphate-dependent transferase [Globomyces pollinis-pini]